MTGFPIAVLVVLLGLPSVQSAQSGCQRIDDSHPAQYLKFERLGTKKPINAQESNDRAWLRLHNNTTCPIQIYGGRLHVRPDGTVTFDPDDGEEASVEYDVYDSTRGGEPKPWAQIDAHTVASVRPGFSVVFDVPLSHFRRGLGIAVPFSYAWEHSSPGDFQLRHYLFLLPEEIPVTARGRFR